MSIALAIKGIEQVLKNVGTYKEAREFLKRHHALKTFWPGAKKVLATKIAPGARTSSGATLTQKQCKALNKYLQKSKKIFK